MKKISSKNPKIHKEYPLVDLRGEYKGIITWSEIISNDILEVSREILGEGTRLKEKLNTSLSTVVIGQKVKQEHIQELIELGADKVIVVEHPKLGDYLNRPYTEALVQVINYFKPEIFIFGATTTGRGLAPRIAARLEVGLSADCTQFNIGEFSSRSRKQRFENIAHFIRPSFGESKLATIIGPFSFPQMATARPGALLPLKRESRTGEIINFEIDIPDEDFNVKIIETIRGEGEMNENLGVDPNSRIIISGGYGIGKEGFKLLKKFVKLLSAQYNVSLGASRKAVEAGLISSAHQVGQTGRSVKPHWYFAIGISGAIQHLAGIKHCKRVVAINKDPDAPIFAHSDYGIVGRYEDIIPELMKAIENGKKLPLL